MGGNRVKIPKSFKLFGTTVEVVRDDKRLDDMECFGLWEYGHSRITLAETSFGEQLSEGKRLDTFYHERTHAILSAMRENELTKNEQFVDVFSKLLRQAIETEEY